MRFNKHCSWWAVGFLGLALSVLACSGDHNRLAKSASGGGGAGASSTAKASSVVSVASSGSGGATTEPEGATTLTVVNGIVDYAAVRLCFTPFPEGPNPAIQPWPQAATGLPFARGATVPVDTRLPTASDVEVWAIGGQLELAGGSDCATLTSAAPEGLVARSLGVLPASALVEPKSLVLVTSGCLGARKHGGPSQELACGVGYTHKTPTASMIAGFLSRINNPNAVSLQFIQAGRALDQVNLRLTPGKNGATASNVANKWSWGAIVPFPPLDEFSRDALGDLSQAKLDMYPSSGSTIVYTSTIQQTLESSSVQIDDIKNGSNLVVVGVGAAPSLGEGSWWNTYRMTTINAGTD